MFRGIAMPALEGMSWFEFFCVVGCPLLWGSAMGIFYLGEVTNAGLVDGFAMAFSSLTANMVAQVVSNWINGVLAGHTLNYVAVFNVCCVYVAHVSLIVLLLNCQRRIQLVYFARKSGGGLSEEEEEQLSTFVPIKAVASGITPILIADMLSGGGLNAQSGLGKIVMYCLIVFSICLTDFNNVPTELAEMVTKMGTRVPGVRPGTATVDYLQVQQMSTRVVGAIGFVSVIIISLFFNRFLGHYSSFFSFTSNIILVRRSAARPAPAAPPAPRRRWRRCCRACRTSERSSTSPRSRSARTPHRRGSWHDACYLCCRSLAK